MHVATVTRTNEHRDPNKLKNHPLNIKLYGGKPPKPEFIASVKKHGILEPLLITSDDVVIAGHTRKDAARIAGLKDVQVIVLRDVTDPLDLEELLIISNRQREKDNETLAREAARLADIEEERAAARLKQTQTVPGEKVGAKAMAHAPQPTKPEKNEDSGNARGKVADALGVGEKSAGKLIEAGRELEKAEESGDTKHAEKIKAGLQQSVSAGHKAATGNGKADDSLKDRDGHAVPKSLREVFAIAGTLKSLRGKVGSVLNDLENIRDTDGGSKLPMTEIRVDAKNLQSAIKAGEPHAVCPYCNGKACKQCNEKGWLTQDQYSGIPKERRHPA